MADDEKFAEQVIYDIIGQILLEEKENDLAKPILEAARMGRFDRVFDSIGSFENVFKYQDSHGMTLLHYSVVYGNISAAKMFIQKGSPLNLKNREAGATPLHLAVKDGFLDIVQILVENGADVVVGDHVGHSSIHYAAIYDYAYILNYLIMTSHVHPDIPDLHGRTPLMWALFKNSSLLTVKSLVRLGADLNYKTTFNECPLNSALLSNSATLIDFVLCHLSKIELNKEDIELIGAIYFSRIHKISKKISFLAGKILSSVRHNQSFWVC
ncbi:ankyrin [Rozella allomycis CSF55]|uniref:Ankyrin n=1 Tax=Rozella allomycis (strain CSF55) TaxID=988480 RepID=A0A4V1IZG2_ROZAC|nr:ankyrin [Rozella allomycis CSF55]